MPIESAVPMPLRLRRHVTTGLLVLVPVVLSVLAVSFVFNMIDGWAQPWAGGWPGVCGGAPQLPVGAAGGGGAAVRGAAGGWPQAGAGAGVVCAC